MHITTCDPLKSPTKDWCLTVEAMPHGGYVVRQQGPSHSYKEGVFCPAIQLYASLDLKDCFKFIEKQIYRPENR